MLSDEEWEALLGEEQRARWAAEQDCQHWQEKSEETEAGAADLRQVLDALAEAVSNFFLDVDERPLCHRQRALTAAWNSAHEQLDATDAGRAHLEADAKREALGKEVTAMLDVAVDIIDDAETFESRLMGDLETDHRWDEARARGAVQAASAAGWLQEEDET